MFACPGPLHGSLPVTIGGVVIQYDEKTIREFAVSLYAQARRIELVYGFLGMLVGIAAGIAGGQAVDGGPFVVILAALAGIAIGVAFARHRASMLRLQAQLALCQAKIEGHLRALRAEGTAARAG